MRWGYEHVQRMHWTFELSHGYGRKMTWVVPTSSGYGAESNRGVRRERSSALRAVDSVYGHIRAGDVWESV